MKKQISQADRNASSKKDDSAFSSKDIPATKKGLDEAVKSNVKTNDSMLNDKNSPRRSR